MLLHKKHIKHRHILLQNQHNIYNIGVIKQSLKHYANTYNTFACLLINFDDTFEEKVIWAGSATAGCPLSHRRDGKGQDGAHERLTWDRATYLSTINVFSSSTISIIRRITQLLSRELCLWALKAKFFEESSRLVWMTILGICDVILNPIWQNKQNGGLVICNRLKYLMKRFAKKITDKLRFKINLVPYDLIDFAVAICMPYFSPIILALRWN